MVLSIRTACGPLRWMRRFVTLNVRHVNTKYLPPSAFSVPHSYFPTKCRFGLLLLG